MNEMQIFSNPQFGEVRTITRDGEPWFVGKDVASILGYKDTVNAIKSHVDDEDKGGWQITTPSGIQQMTVINESGLYSLVLSSKLPTAKQFKRWVTADVLPSIRKSGGYIHATPTESPEEIMAKALRIADETIKRQAERVSRLEEQAEQDKPKVLFADAVSASKNSILIGEFAKLLRQNGVNVGQNRLFDWLRENKYLMKSNIPTQRAMEMGLFEVKETAITHSDGHITVSKTPKVTGKGQVYFVEKFLKERKSNAG